ncbi:hypothetical protein TBLA_0I03480 [Henningerozyma blattae CBS 6284]|uniref:Importin N-terminal domain-containing protein n=1 Tax=Henningerozyma blattae (strain ATCC 34711 / CBS 6284 / DSM 70876 / NBRC 10599 / NRRL Y-10934 / UCD 77-7) TaxID=1071380 RepID=I2H9E9_HENB6|nr:hypothetical protein TBLA_0I03480 [Tetrapisispora blattae CBS 6284]CCH63001.1 hypothetical protein TBLA_0I03480 [Tetrapisispora blattae CBS 6284]
MSELESISKLLSDSINAATAKSAERELKAIETQNGFGLTLLHIIASHNLPISTRLAGALFFKNFIKRKWIDENGNHLLPSENIELIKKEIVPLMITLPDNLQVQIGEAISVIADSDFPNNWPTLLNDLASKLSPDDMIQNKGVLTVAHSIFKRWRPLFRSDELFLEIKLVLNVFCEPFLNLLKTVDEQIMKNGDNKASLDILFDVLLLLTKLYYDFNCQDIPEFFEDHIQEGMGILHKYLAYENPLLVDQEEDDEVTIIIKVKASIQQVVQLYTTRYEDVFGSMINEFIQVTWNLLTTTSAQPKNDILISKSLSFLTAIARIPKYFEFFNNDSTMNDIILKIILPNVMLRENDIELFEDDPIEYIRRDLEGSDVDTRRRACVDFLKELKTKNGDLVTNVLLSHIEKFFQEYNSSPQNNWKYKDLSVFLFSALAIDGNVTSVGVSSTNKLLNVVDFFTTHVAPDLTGQVSHVILKVDAIKYIYVFRNQLNKAQLIEIMPILAKFLESDEYVLHTYAAVSIERILSIRESISSSTLIFTKLDISNSAPVLLTNLFKLILRHGASPEKLAENEFLMRAIFRVLQTAEDSVQSMFSELLNHLLSIVSIISKNPSNPRFSHYTFESIGVMLTYIPISNNPSFMDSIMPIFLHILSEDIQEFIPYVFQIVSYSIERSNTVPASVQQLAQPILSPTVWELKGNIPAVTRLIKALIKVNYQVYPDLTPVLGVFQRLIASKSYDVHGFEFLETILLFVPLDVLKPFLKQIAVLLLQRLQSSRTDKYLKKLTVLVGMLSIKLGSDFVIHFIDDVQDGIFSQIWSNFIITTLPTLGNLLDRKLALLGIVNFITNSQLFTSKYSNLIPITLEKLVETTVSQSIANLKSEYIDLESMEEASTFGSTYSKLGSISEKPFDPVPEIDLTNGVRKYISDSLKKYNAASGNTFFSNVASQLPSDVQLKLNEIISGN